MTLDSINRSNLRLQATSTGYSTYPYSNTSKALSQRKTNASARATPFIHTANVTNSNQKRGVKVYIMCNTVRSFHDAWLRSTHQCHEKRKNAVLLSASRKQAEQKTSRAEKTKVTDACTYTSYRTISFMQWHRSSTHQHHHTWGSLVNVERLHETGHLPSIHRPENNLIRVPHSEGRGYLYETLNGPTAIRPSIAASAFLRPNEHEHRRCT